MSYNQLGQYGQEKANRAGVAVGLLTGLGVYKATGLLSDLFTKEVGTILEHTTPHAGDKFNLAVGMLTGASAVAVGIWARNSAARSFTQAEYKPQI